MLSAGSYQQAFDNARTGLLLLDRTTGRVLAVNAAFLRMAARARDELLGRSFWEPPLIADAEAGAEIHRHLLADGVVECAEVPLQTAGGHWLVIEVRGSPSGSVVQVEVLDVTARERARLAGRLEALRSQAGRTAVEFANLHRTLRIMGELLLASAGRGKPLLRELEEIRQASERATAIAGQLRAFSGGSVFSSRPVVLNEVVEATLPRLRSLFGRDIEVVADLSPDLAPVKAHPAIVRQIILRLAANSREAMVRGGTFCLRTSNASAVEPGLGSGHEQGGPYGMLAISDNGPGLDAPSWEHLYEPFFSTKAHHGNLGLGLAAVYGVVRQMEGRLWAYSQPGNGATFRIYLPRPVGEFPALPASRPGGGARSATILLVEADDGLRSVMVKLLQRHGYPVLAARQPREALRIAEAHAPPDLLIAGHEPEMIEHLARRQPALRVLLMGRHGDDLVARALSLPPAVSMLRKPFEPDTLLTAIEELLEQPL